MRGKKDGEEDEKNKACDKRWSEDQISETF